MPIVDGLGGEEMGQLQEQTSQIYITGSVIAGGDISGANVYSTGALNGATVVGTTSVSGANSYAAATVAGSQIKNSKGLIYSPNIGSPAVYNCAVQAGTVTMSAGSNAAVQFGVPFSSKVYAITFGASGAGASATLPTLSGTATSSGALVIGDADATYYYVAVGY